MFICNFTCKITKLPWQPSVHLWSFKMLWIKVVRALKDTLENLNTWKSTSKRILTGICRKILKNMNLSQFKLWTFESVEFLINMIQDKHVKIHNCECNSSPIIKWSNNQIPSLITIWLHILISSITLYSNSGQRAASLLTIIITICFCLLTL